MALQRHLLRRGGGPDELLHRVAGRGPQQHEREGDDTGHDGRAGQRAAGEREEHTPNLARLPEAR